ncbi:MAG: hypothetical protein A2V98_21590 [Planctomycetes bacterium RBG_16_64_12]|nr:MAG: hypothetical protein A2V98_21590 [Planctomycetes bacterium RBG_16_64_12]
MRTRFWRLLILAAVAANGDLAAQPPEGSQLAPDENACVMCHGEKELWEGENLRLYMPADQFADDIHWQKGVNCHDCHGGDPTVFDPGDLHAAEDGFRELADVRKACGNCHKDQLTALRKGVHAKAGERDENDRGTPMDCGACHGANLHRVYPAKDSRSPVFSNKQVQTCGGCHEEDLQTYAKTVHGNGLFESGLMVTAVCSSCHGAHGIYYAADVRSTLHPANVAATCGKCHRFIEERLEASEHGRGSGPGRPAERAAPGGAGKRKPSCTDCHQSHEMLNPEELPFQLALSNRCGNCHPDLSSRYGMSLHGELTRLGYAPAAQCDDCHGAHDILPVSDPKSHLAAGKNRLATCRQCHLHAVRNFSSFDPHANYTDAQNYPFLHFAYSGMEGLFYFFFGFFIIHAFLWFLRSFIHTFQQGRHKTLVTDSFALVRFEAIHRVLYLILIVAFLGLTLSGLPLKYGGQSLARGLGGFDSTRIWHHFFAVLAIFGCAAHLVWGTTRITKLRKEGMGWKAILFGPDSPLPGARDFKDLFGMVRWFFGMGPKPGFERWTYWEKFDYWAAYLAAAVIGTSGLMLWFPNLFCTVLPGFALNVAKVIHSELAIMAASFLFIFHFFHTHVRPEKFPMDLSALTGLVSEEHLRKARPEYVERLEREGKLLEIRRTVPSRKRLRLIMLGGFLVFLAGCGLLVAILFANLGK